MRQITSDESASANVLAGCLVICCGLPLRRDCKPEEVQLQGEIMTPNTHWQLVVQRSSKAYHSYIPLRCSTEAVLCAGCI